MILAIETSCDDTCAAVVDDDGRTHANVISSQGIHDAYGGVVPELAARAHVERCDLVVADALRTAGVTLDAIDRVAVTRGPGLVGALLVGLQTAKAIAVARDLPLIPVDHLHGHVLACTLQPLSFEPPFVALVASGGHSFLARVEDPDTIEVLGGTLDDAAGEAVDKGARLLGLPYPGGPHLERLAADGDPTAFAFPTGAKVRGLDCSFSGLKTSLLYRLRDLGEEQVAARRADLAASYQRAIVETLAVRVERALELTGIDRLAVGGGVAANGPLRERLAGLGAAVAIPDRALCTDNAAMIAAVARFRPAVDGDERASLEAYGNGQRPPIAA
ncbi:YgjD/Kae1/Qri7 family required for threonylcarbamoyladenosine (t(6)A) formation in tRNA [Patulibacter medicamentivorans]|uniref:tRNA N6-adenosine threonylcarbamoyltransferase n=1 Tax=Patulibacter medicamentivorans TaxID=1097667 RepID=H0EBI9_9ACTN|nr:tRNA (adenosine(37)-N6)-threonylcarbamoyltransferase complex transferase subunit TsaD [Patulibacter medicamentivorans]EHN08970.1 YgjD/Kae1/Qri7 family required for threonylcarbamoyladenosine (t(6)A) formation in tRNA [Patulibacter medicamentivorans]